MLKQKNEINKYDENAFLMVRILYTINLWSFNLQCHFTMEF